MLQGHVVAGKCSGDMCTHMKMWQVHVSGISCSDMSTRVNWYFYNEVQEVQQVELHGTRGCNISLQHIPETCTRNIFTCVQMS